MNNSTEIFKEARAMGMAVGKLIAIVMLIVNLAGNALFWYFMKQTTQNPSSMSVEATQNGNGNNIGQGNKGGE